MAWNDALNGPVLKCWDADENSKNNHDYSREVSCALTVFPSLNEDSQAVRYATGAQTQASFQPTENKSARMVEAGGVEPPSEKPCHPKTTCLSHSSGFVEGAQNGQDAPPTSPIDLAGALRTKTRRPAYCVTPHPKRAGDAWGDALPNLG